MKWITASDIKNWPNTQQRRCSELLPELVRRLVLATASLDAVQEIDFPSGDSITSGGWDGRLKTSVISPFFASGMSGWEMGTENSPGKKAESDYATRTTDSLGLQHGETTFVFVTPRVWPGRGKWQAEKILSKTWKDVKVIGADSLAQWLDSAPAVALWLAKQMGKVISDGIRGLEDVWEEWSLATDPRMTAELVIGGRTRDVEQVHKWLKERPRVLSVQGDSPDEAQAFLHAAIMALPEIISVQALSRCVVVETLGELRQVTQAYQHPLIIVAPGQCVEGVGAALAKGHHVFLSMDAKLIEIGNVLRLSRPQRNIIEKGLANNGKGAAEAQRLARDFGRSIPVLRRHLYRSSAVRAPSWADQNSAPVLLPALLAGAWIDGRAGDKTVIEALSGHTYDEFADSMQRFVVMPDAPIRKVGDVWMLKSPLDAWFLLARHLTDEHLKKFLQAIIAVLTKTDPKYDLPTEQRWAAAVYGKSQPYSQWLRTGLVESLVLLAVYGDRAQGIISPQAFSDRAVKEILSAARTWEAWASLNDATPLLAEASPDAFINIIRAGIASNPTLFQEMMTDEPGFFGECKHSGVLWALESLAWSPLYLGGAVEVLGGLARIDSGGRWSNRPANSLKEILQPRYPQTHAAPDERLAAFDKLSAVDPRGTWEFAKSYCSSNGFFSESHRLRWRDPGGNRRGLEPETSQDFKEYVSGLLPRLTSLACHRENLAASMKDFTRFPPAIRDALVAELKRADPSSFPQEEREPILQALRDALNWLNTHADADRRKQVPDLNEVLKRFAPVDVLQRVGWLLSNPWPRLPEGDPDGYEGRDDRVFAAQEQAAREVLDSVSIDAILDYAKTLQYPGVFGHALGRAVHTAEDPHLLGAMLQRSAEVPSFITGYAAGRIQATSTKWAIEQIEHLKSRKESSPEACAAILLALPEGADSWALVSELGGEVERAYWQRARGYPATEKARDIPIAVEKLLEVGRPSLALELAGDPTVSIRSSLLRQLIQKILEADPSKSYLAPGGMLEFHLGHVFRQFYDREEFSVEEIAQLEWPFAALFDGIKQYASSSLAIHRVLQKDPAFYASLVALMYRRDDNSPEPSQEGLDKPARERLAHNARLVVDSWQLLPGLAEDGSIDERHLVAWVEAARQQCAATHHVTGGDIQLGFILARAPADPDGLWPHKAFRNLIELINNDIVDKHVEVGLFNSRGVVSRGLGDGGVQEKELASSYIKMSESLKAKSPRTAAILRSLGESYVHFGKRLDLESELNDLRWN